MELFHRTLGNSGDTIIILHGLLGSSDNWLTQGKMLAEEYRVYLVDQRNHGLSPKSETFDYDILAEDIAGFMDQHNIQIATLIGHSMGGKAAMKFAFKHPDRIERLVVVDIAPKAYPIQHDHILEGLKSIPIDTIQSRNQADETLSEHIKSAGVRQFLLKNLSRKENGFEWKANLTVLDRSMQIISNDIGLEGSFPKPTLFIRGSQSDYIEDQDRDLITAYFPNSHLVTLEAGHWVQAEKPNEFVATLKSFLKQYPA